MLNGRFKLSLQARHQSSAGTASSGLPPVLAPIFVRQHQDIGLHLAAVMTDLCTMAEMPLTSSAWAPRASLRTSEQRQHQRPQCFVLTMAGC